MSTLLLALALHLSGASAQGSAPPGHNLEAADDHDGLSEEQAALRVAWRECLFDRADALAGYAGANAERAAALASAGCEEKADAFRQAVRDTATGAAGAALIARQDQAMRRYALVVAKAARAFPGKAGR